MDEHERRLAASDRVAGRHPEHRALVQPEHEPEVVGEPGEERHLGRAGVREERRQSAPAEDVERRIADGPHDPQTSSATSTIRRELRPLLVLGEHVALDGRGEAALRREAELLERRVLRGLLDAALQLVLRLELAALRRHEAEHDLLVALRQEAQRLEAARALVVPLHEEPVHLELVQELFCDEVVAALGRPGGAEVAAAHVGRHGHPGRAVGQRFVDVTDVLDVLALGVAADRGDVVPLMRVVHVREARVVELQVGAAELAEPAHLVPVGGRQVGPELVERRVHGRVDRPPCRRGSGPCSARGSSASARSCVTVF